MNGILAFLMALPQILQSVNEIIKFLKSTFGDDWHKYLADAGAVFKQLNQAKTEDEKFAAAEALSKLASRWGTPNAS